MRAGVSVLLDNGSVDLTKPFVGVIAFVHLRFVETFDSLLDEPRWRVECVLPFMCC